MHCLIIAAGQGTRLAAYGDSKPLIPVAGRPLIEWAILNAAQSGVDEFVVVSGYNGQTLDAFLKKLAARRGFIITTVENDQWQKENGLSVWKARDHLRGPFMLMMADHIVSAEILAPMVKLSVASDEIALAVDDTIRDNPNVDLDDVTKVLVEHGRIQAIGKSLGRYNAFDTGVFHCSSALFTALEESMAKGDYTLSGGIRILAANGKARAVPINGAFWIDVDDKTALDKAEKWLGCKNRR